MVEPAPLENILGHAEYSRMHDASREDILKQIFGDIGELVDDFTCAVESTVLLHGRMYITNRFICFYSNLFGLEKKIRIPYTHIRKISKENTAMVIPNAIAISTDKKDYTFRSFWDREDCFRILTAFLSKFKGGPGAGLAIKERASVVIPLEGVEADSPHNSEPKEKVGLNDAEFDSESGAAVARGDQDKHAMFEEEVTKSTLKIPVITGEKLNISLKDFAALYIDDGALLNYKKYHESVKDADVVLSEWSAPTSMGSTREMKFFKPVNLPGLASTRGIKVQKFRMVEDVGLILCSSTRLEDVPAADTFSVEDTLVIRVLDETTVSVEITFQVHFLKSTMMKYIIEKSTNGEMARWLETFSNYLKKTTELKREGKLDLSVAAAPAPVVVEAVVEAPVEVKKAPVGFMALLSFNNENVGDQIKFGLCLLLVLYLFVNYTRWEGLVRKLDDVEAKMQRIEYIAKQLLARSEKLTN